ALERMINTASDLGFNYGNEILQRWRAELPAPKSGNSPEDPFFLVRTLEEIEQVLEKNREESHSYGAAHAFIRIAPKAKYDATKALFDKEQILHSDEQVIEMMAQIAIKHGHFADAE